MIQLALIDSPSSANGDTKTLSNPTGENVTLQIVPSTAEPLVPPLSVDADACIQIDHHQNLPQKDQFENCDEEQIWSEFINWEVPGLLEMDEDDFSRTLAPHQSEKQKPDNAFLTQEADINHEKRETNGDTPAESSPSPRTTLLSSRLQPSQLSESEGLQESIVLEDDYRDNFSETCDDREVSLLGQRMGKSSAIPGGHASLDQEKKDNTVHVNLVSNQNVNPVVETSAKPHGKALGSMVDYLAMPPPKVPVIGYQHRGEGTCDKKYTPGDTRFQFGSVKNILEEQNQRQLVNGSQTISPPQEEFDTSIERSMAFRNPLSLKAQANTGSRLSPFINNLSRYSPQHRADIKFIIRNSPASISRTPKSVLQADVLKSGLQADLLKSGQADFSPLRHRQGEGLTFKSRVLPGRSMCFMVDRYLATREDAFCLEWRCHKSETSSVTLFKCPFGMIYGDTASIPDVRSTLLDRYGNTILHIIGSLPAYPEHLWKSIRQFDNINAQNSGGETFLHVLHPQNYDLEILQLLGQRGFDFTQRDDLGQTIVQSLLRHGLALERFYPSWQLLTGSNNAVVAEALSEEYGFMPSTYSYSYLRPIYDENGDTDLIRLLHFSNRSEESPQKLSIAQLMPLARFRDRMGRSPLHYAVGYGEVEATKLFIQHNARAVHARDVNGMGVVEMACFELQLAKFHIDLTLYSRISACMALVMDAGGVARPTFDDEWSM